MYVPRFMSKHKLTDVNLLPNLVSSIEQERLTLQKGGCWTLSAASTNDHAARVIKNGLFSETPLYIPLKQTLSYLILHVYSYKVFKMY